MKRMYYWNAIQWIIMLPQIMNECFWDEETIDHLHYKNYPTLTCFRMLMESWIESETSYYLHKKLYLSQLLFKLSCCSHIVLLGVWKTFSFSKY